MDSTSCSLLLLSLVDGFPLVSKYVVMTQTTRNLGQGGRYIVLTTHKQTIHVAD